MNKMENTSKNLFLKVIIVGKAISDRAWTNYTVLYSPLGKIEFGCRIMIMTELRFFF